jgi:hypothetical protein
MRIGYAAVGGLGGSDHGVEKDSIAAAYGRRYRSVRYPACVSAGVLGQARRPVAKASCDNEI